MNEHQKIQYLVSAAERRQCTPFFKSTDINPLSRLVCLLDKMVDLALWLVRSIKRLVKGQFKSKLSLMNWEPILPFWFYTALTLATTQNTLATTRTLIVHNSHLLKKFKCQEKMYVCSNIMVPSYQMYFPKAGKSEEMVCSSSFSHVLSINTDGLKTQTAIAVFTDPWQRGCVSSVPLVLSLPHPSNRQQSWERQVFGSCRLDWKSVFMERPTDGVLCPNSDGQCWCN